MVTSVKQEETVVQNNFTEDEFYMYDDIAEQLKEKFEEKYPAVRNYIPTISELEFINIENHVREYIPFIIYLIKHLDDIKKAGEEKYSEEELQAAAEARSFLDNLQFTHMIDEYNSEEDSNN